MNLITGGTGSFGHAYLKYLTTHKADERIRVLSRDEEKQRRMAAAYPDVEFVIGDVRDRDALRRVMPGIKSVFHAAALKQVPQCEFNPGEAYRTNVVGTENVCMVAAEFGANVTTLSTDKAVEPAGVMGATKFLAEQITTSYGFNAVRYGNVIGSRGSIVPVFRKMVADGKPITITDPEMTRFVITLGQAIQLLMLADFTGERGSIFVMKSPAASVAQMVRVIAPGHPTEIVGVRPGEKQHEDLIAAFEHAEDHDWYYRVIPHATPTGLTYSSLTAPTLADDELAALIAKAPTDDVV